MLNEWETPAAASPGLYSVLAVAKFIKALSQGSLNEISNAQVFFTCPIIQPLVTEDKDIRPTNYYPSLLPPFTLLL